MFPGGTFLWKMSTIRTLNFFLRCFQRSYMNLREGPRSIVIKFRMKKNSVTFTWLVRASQNKSKTCEFSWFLLRIFCSYQIAKTWNEQNYKKIVLSESCPFQLNKFYAKWWFQEKVTALTKCYIFNKSVKNKHFWQYFCEIPSIVNIVTSGKN